MSLANPTVSVIIPTYNRAHLISRSIRSVLAQSYQDFELIVVDDDSTDNTEEIVTSFHNNMIRYIRLDKNSGTPAVPTNVGIGAARGQYIAVQDSDDEWLPTKLEKQMAVFKSLPPELGVVYTDMWWVKEDGTKDYFRSPRIMPEDGIIYEEALGYRVAYIGTQTLVIRKVCFDKAGLFDEIIRMYIDTELLIRMSKYCLFYHIDEPLVNYFRSPGTVITSKKATIEARKYILEKYYRDIRKNRKLLASHYLMINQLYREGGQFRDGRHFLMKAVEACPLDMKILLTAFVSLWGERIFNKAGWVKRKIDSLSLRQV